jgi:hypothetical protein
MQLFSPRKTLSPENKRIFDVYPVIQLINATKAANYFSHVLGSNTQVQVPRMH